MTHETARRSVSRLWLRAFAGIVSVLAAAIPAAASEGVVSTNLNAIGAFSQEINGRSPLRAFATRLGVYELDTALKGVRVWQRDGQGLELLRPGTNFSFRPYTTRQIEQAPANQRPQRFVGVDAAGKGIAFKQPVGLDLVPNADKGARIAVLSVGEYINQGLNRYSPSIQVYDIEETESDDRLSSVKIALDQEFDNAFYTTTNGMTQILDRIYTYPDILVTTNYFSDGSIASVVTNNFMTCTTNLLDRTVFTNWVLVLHGMPDLETQTNIVSQTGLETPLFINENDTSLFIPGFEYTIVRTYDRYSVTTNFYSFTNYVWKYSITTNASYLSSATDVAFLDDGGLVASITADDFQSVRSGFLVFGSSPSDPAKIFPVGDLNRAVKGIAVDKNSGDIYAAVPDMAAVFRYKAPSGGWTAASPEPVFHDDFVAGVTNFPGASLGLLSNPADVSVWYPDPEEPPILLVADTANGRVQAFDPNSLTWVATNWLGRKVDCWPDGSPFDEEILPFVSTNASGAVVTNFYRLETTAFPLFTAGETGAVSSDPMTGPRGVAGRDGEELFAVADTAAHRVRLYGLDLEQLDSEEILSMFVRWPTVDGPWPNFSYRDMAVVDGADGTPVVLFDAPHTNALDSETLLVQEIDGYEYELHFTVAPSRKPRTYALSVANGNGVVAAAAPTTVTVPAGETEGVLAFTAADGILTQEETVSWRDQYGNWAPEDKGAYAVTNRYFATPAYTLSLSSGGYSTNATLAVANVDPQITNAVFSGRLVMTMSGPVLYVTNLTVSARDWVEADAGLRYLWWATTNINWGLNNLAWAVTNNDWASGASSSDWSEGPSFEAVQNTTASAITGTETSGPVTNRIELMVQTGCDAKVPYGYHKRGILSTTDRNNAPFLVVCTILDKDGGAAIITFPTAADTSGTADLWSYGDGGGGGGGGESTAVYAVAFTDVSGTNVTFVVSLSKGDPGVYDTVTLQSSATLDGADDPASGNWTKLRQYNVGTMTLPATINLTPAGTGNVRFYRVVKP